VKVGIDIRALGCVTEISIHSALCAESLGRILSTSDLKFLGVWSRNDGVECEWFAFLALGFFFGLGTQVCIQR
jgi:hypothetical protein